jgi:hypothetical protein
MLNKTWAFALAVALAAAAVSSLLAAGGGAAGSGTPNGENATAGTAAANASTPAAHAAVVRDRSALPSWAMTCRRPRSRPSSAAGSDVHEIKKWLAR